MQMFELGEFLRYRYESILEDPPIPQVSKCIGTLCSIIMHRQTYFTVGIGCLGTIGRY